MLTSEFQYGKNVLQKYFNNNYKWKLDADNGLYQYYKNPKRCLKELKFMIDVVFQGDYNILETNEVRNIDNELVGYSITGLVNITDDFNGIYQDSGSSIEYLEIALCSNGFWFNQSTILEHLKR